MCILVNGHYTHVYTIRVIYFCIQQTKLRYCKICFIYSDILRCDGPKTKAATQKLYHTKQLYALMLFCKTRMLYILLEAGFFLEVMETVSFLKYLKQIMNETIDSCKIYK